MEYEDILMRNQELAHKNQILEKENIELKAQITILFKLIENMNKPVYLPTAPANVEPLPPEPNPSRRPWWASPSSSARCPNS